MLFFIVYMQLIMKLLQEMKRSMYTAALLCEIAEKRVYQD
jgi:hypothetical protein